jgi:hypothetical protein
MKFGVFGVMKKKGFYYLDKITTGFEVVIGMIILLIIAVKVIEMILSVVGIELLILPVEFESVLSVSFILVIGVELVKMLYKHTPETVIDVLLFAIARQMVMYHEGTMDMLIGVAAISGLFAAKKFLIAGKAEKNQNINT